MRPIMTRTKGITSAATPREFDERRRCGFSFVRERLESLRLFSRMLREELGLLLDELGELGSSRSAGGAGFGDVVTTTPRSGDLQGAAHDSFTVHFVVPIAGGGSAASRDQAGSVAGSSFGTAPASGRTSAQLRTSPAAPMPASTQNASA
jgi:hypothetical protein